MRSATNFVYVFIEKYPFFVKDAEIYPQERLDEIEKCKNFDVKNQKFFVWKLLEKACKKLGIDFKNIKFYKIKSKWKCEDFFFSLSHSKGIVVVAISNKEVGIDVEKAIHARFAKFPSHKFLAENEVEMVKEQAENSCENSCAKGEIFNKLWTAKEAVFKAGEYLGFKPYKVSLMGKNYVIKTLICGKEKFYLSVAGDGAEGAEFYPSKKILIK